MSPKLVLLALLAFALPASAWELEGCISMHDGSLAKDARVSIGIVDQPLLATTRSVDGCFRFAGLPQSVLEVSVDVEGEPTLRVLAVPNEPPMSIIVGGEEEESGDSPMPKGDRTIDGTVTLNDQPLAGVPILLSGTTGSTIRVLTDSKGRFLAKSVPASTIYVNIDRRLSHLRIISSPETFAELEQETHATIDFALTRPRIISGRIVDANDQPVSGARVQVVLSGRATSDFVDEPFVRSRADGRYAIAAPWFDSLDQAAIAVILPAHSTVRSAPFFIRDRDLAIDLRLPPFEPVTARVIDAAKSPIRDARVVFTPTDEFSPLFIGSALVNKEHELWTVRTNEKGEALLQLAPHAYIFGAAAENHLTAMLKSRAIAKRADDEPSTIEIALDHAFTLRGRVHRGEKGVEHVNVSVDVPAALRDEADTLTDANGTFELKGLPPGTFTVTVSKIDEMVEERRTIDVPSPPLDIALEPTGTLTLTAIDAQTREPVERFSSTIEPMQGPSFDALWMLGDADPKTGLTVTRGGYRIITSASGYLPARAIDVSVKANETTEAQVILERGFVVTGRVRDESGSPIESARVIVFPKLRDRTTIPPPPPGGGTDANGAFTISGLEGGEARMEVQSPGFVPLHKVIVVDETLEPLDLQLSRGLTIEGVVTREGRGVPNAQLIIFYSAAHSDTSDTESDTNGRFVLTGLVASRYVITASKDDATVTVRNVDPAKQHQLTIALDDKPHGVLYGTVIGMPAPSAIKILQRTVYASSQDGSVEGWIDDAGTYRIEDAPTGQIIVNAAIETTEGSRSSARKEVTLAAGQTLRVDLAIDGTVRVAGRVFIDGKASPVARVMFLSNDGAGAYTLTRDDGAYDISLPSPGFYRITASAEGLEREFTTEREIRGGETIDLDLRTQTIEGMVVDAATRTPIAGANVRLVSPASMDTIIESARTASSGAFRINIAAAGAYRRKRRSIPRRQHIAPLTIGASPIAPLSIALTAAQPTRIRVVDAANGTSLHGSLDVFDERGQVIPTRFESEIDGTTYLSWLAPGRYRLRVTVPGYTAQEIEFTAPSNIDVRME